MDPYTHPNLRPPVALRTGLCWLGRQATRRLSWAHAAALGVVLFIVGWTTLFLLFGGPQ